jgi:hypothetical protein
MELRSGYQRGSAQSLPYCSRTATLSSSHRHRDEPDETREKRNKLLMTLERKNLTLTLDANAVLADLERTMVASIALMKRLRRERRRSARLERSPEQQSA